MKYCSACGSEVVLGQPLGETRQRYICGDCHAIHYHNPRVVVGCIATYGERVLLCRRAIEPKSGLWTIPAGFLECGETTQAGAAREAWEEACAMVDDLVLFRIAEAPEIDEIYMVYRCQLRSPDVRPGPESKEVGLFAYHEIPWGYISFPKIAYLLKAHFDCGRSSFTNPYPQRQAGHR